MPLRLIPDETKILFMRYAPVAFPASLLAMVASLALFFVIGTLVIGILTTMFTAFLLTRLIIAMWVSSSRPHGAGLWSVRPF